MKEGAEDLWNNDDGPIKPPNPHPPPTHLHGVQSTRRGSTGSPVDLRRLVGEASNPISRNSGGSLGQSRGYRSVSEGNSGVVSSKKLVPAGRRRFCRNDSTSSSESGSDDDEGDSRVNWDVRKMGSSASLGKYDVKRERRVVPKPYDEEDDFSEQVELIKYEINKRKLEQKEEEKHKGEERESILTQSRYSNQVLPFVVYDFVLIWC